MLDIRPNCECCGKDLAPDATNARICTFECTFCQTCADDVLHGLCPNCGGNLEVRPIRPAAALLKFPASTVRVAKNQHCEGVEPDDRAMESFIAFANL
jgi:hypothetical protein